jgi:hypothetical protein
MREIDHGDLRHNGGFQHGDDDLADQSWVHVGNGLRQNDVNEHCERGDAEGKSSFTLARGNCLDPCPKNFN